MEPWQILVLGALGGFLNCILFKQGFVLPNIGKDNGQYLLRPGFLGNILMGAAAGFLIDVFMARELEFRKQIALVFLGGLGGGNVLISFLQQHIIKVIEDKIEALANVVEEMTKTK